MSKSIPLYIPAFINDQQYSPARVLPRLFFYNGMIDCEPWYFEHRITTNNVIGQQIDKFPYFDHYNVVTGSFPTTGSLSLLFNNETAVYGATPTASLYTEYFEKYINLLYNPYTRLLNAKAIIPLADYFDMELNDVVNFRGNYWHLRAINNYSLKTGDCDIQLLGPVDAPAIDNLLAECAFTFTSSLVPTTTTTTTAGPETVFYEASIGSGLTRTLFYTDYNNVARSETFDAVRNYRFAAISGSVSFNNSLGCTLTVLQQPFTPTFLQYSVFFGPTQIPTYYINYQQKDGSIENRTNYNYQTSVCVVSGSFSATGGLNWPVGYWRLTETGTC